MAKVVGFRIEGLAGRADVYEQNLASDVNVFFGPNGGGKTSLLRLIHSALENDPMLLTRTAFKKAEIRFRESRPERNIVRTFKADQLPQNTGGTRTFASLSHDLRQILAAEKLTWATTDPQGKRSSASYPHVYLPTSRLYTGGAPPTLTDPSANRRRLEEDALDDAFANLLNERWRDYTAGVLRRVEFAQAQGLARILQAFFSAEPLEPTASASTTDLTPSYGRLVSFLKRQHAGRTIGDLNTFRQRYLADFRLQRVVDDIDQVEQAIAAAREPTTRFQKLISELFAGDKSLVFEDGGLGIKIAGDRKIGLANLSSGEKHLLRILVDVMSAGDTTVLIDEPEISMHVDWQARFIELIRLVNPHCQLIVATHSPEVTGPVSEENLFRVE